MEIIEAWAVGYARCRGYSAPVPIPGGLWMEVGQPAQTGRIVLKHYDAAVVSDLMARIDAPGIYIELPVEPEAAVPLVGSRWTVRDRAYLMTCGIPDEVTNERLRRGYSVAVNEDAGVVRVEVWTDAGELAASGCCAIFQSICVFDRIITHEHHRRRGLGTLVMARLAHVAHGLSARSGILIATADGRSLYNALGWSEHSPITSAISP